MQIRSARFEWLLGALLAMAGLLACAASPVFATGPSPALAPTPAPVQLVMFEQAGCGWCERWIEDIGGIYHKTAEGRRAPLRRVNIHAPMPADLALLKPGRFTPTFVLVAEGREIGRIRGYPGPDWFWPLLGELLQRAGSVAKESGTTAADRIE